ncbi:phosphatase PAP2 family protein [Pseudopedobacter beijingensis]|uniref:Phosphatase PAP2 family protein n=1 Tax=Pseudopedobacter beijingensis TaxID=1207056 RepID=A0ABW4IHB1_9SPHI
MSDNIVKYSFFGKSVWLRVLVAISFLLLLSVIKMVFLNNNLHLDLWVQELFALYKTPQLTKVVLFITGIGDYPVMITFYVFLIIWLLIKHKNKFLSLKIAFIALASVGLMHILKNIFKRTRPVSDILEPVGYSFPSGHSMNSLVFFCMLIFICQYYLKQRSWRVIVSVLFTLCFLLIGMSRVYLEVHYFTDVVAGFCVGFIWLYAGDSICGYRRG